jgi:hypothetical protein
MSVDLSNPGMVIRLREKIPLRGGYCGEISSLSFGLKDDSGNALVVYRKGYAKLTDAVKKILSSADVGVREKLNILQAYKLSLIRYFSKENIGQYQVQNMDSIDSIPGIRDGGKQNCVVVNDSLVYVIPKVYPSPIMIGVNHSSLCYGRSVTFAGSLVKREDRWVLNNMTGHYGTRASKLSAALAAFIRNNISIDNLDIEHWILIDSTDLYDDASYHIETVPAPVLLKRMSQL